MVGLNLCRCASKKDNANTRMVSVRSLVYLCPVTQTEQARGINHRADEKTEAQKVR